MSSIFVALTWHPTLKSTLSTQLTQSTLNPTSLAHTTQSTSLSTLPFYTTNPTSKSTSTTHTLSTSKSPPLTPSRSTPIFTVPKYDLCTSTECCVILQGYFALNIKFLQTSHQVNPSFNYQLTSLYRWICFI